MVDANSTIALVPSAEFKWTAEIQYKESLASRDEAIRYASLHGCNLIVKYDRRSGPLFDVMHDPALRCTSEANCRSAETVSVVIEPKSAGWSKLMARGVFGLARRLGAAASTSHRGNAMTPAHSQAMAVK
jgi:hypothetical protein